MFTIQGDLKRKFENGIKTKTLYRVIWCLLYRVIQEEMSIFWEVIVLVVVRN